MFNPIKWAIWGCLLASAPLWADEAEDSLLIAKRLIERSVIYEGMSLEALSQTAEDLEIALSQLREVDRLNEGKIREYEQNLLQESGDLPEIIAELIAIEAAPFPNFMAHPDGVLSAAQSRILFLEVMQNYQSRIGEDSEQLSALYEASLLRAQVEDIAQNLLAHINELRHVLVNNQEDPKANADLIAELKALDASLSELQILPDESLENAEIQPLKLDEWQAPVSGKIAVHGEGMKMLTSDYDVKAPLSGVVRLAQSFPNEGKIVMIEPQYGYLIVLMGFDALEVDEGEQVEAGQLIGFFTTEDEKNLSPNSMASPLSQNSLYIELRKDTKPIAFDELRR